MRISLGRGVAAGLVVLVGCASSSKSVGSSADGGSTPSDGASDGSSGSIDAPSGGQVGADGCLNGLASAGPTTTAGMPGLGAHGMHYCKYRADLPKTLVTQPLSTQPSGSVILVGIGRGDNTKFVVPTDNHGNAPYQQIEQMQPYAHPWETSGTALYSFVSAAGGPDFQVMTATGADGAHEDEITVAAVEIVGGTRIVASAWNQPDDKSPTTSNSVTTTGPATLVAFWWGGAFPGTPQSATPGNGFELVDTNAQETGSFVQGAVAVKNVAATGTYDVTWSSTPVQGAQLWLVAVQ